MSTGNPFSESNIAVFARRSCKRKKPYLTYEHANLEIQRLKDNSMNVYECEFCGFFHIGHNGFIDIEEGYQFIMPCGGFDFVGTVIGGVYDDLTVEVELKAIRTMNARNVLRKEKV